MHAGNMYNYNSAGHYNFRCFTYVKDLFKLKHLLFDILEVFNIIIDTNMILLYYNADNMI